MARPPVSTKSLKAKQAASEEAIKRHATEVLMARIEFMYRTNNPAARLKELCALHNVAVADVYAAFAKAVSDTKTDKRERQLLSVMAEPGFLDFHPEISMWYDAISLYRHASKLPGDFHLSDTMFVFNRLFEYEKRELLKSLDLNDPQFQDDDKLRLEIHTRMQGKEDAPIGGVFGKMLGMARSWNGASRDVAPSAVTLTELLGNGGLIAVGIQENRLHEMRNMVANFNQVDRAYLAKLQVPSQSAINHSYNMAVAMRAVMASKHVHEVLTPRHVYDAIFGEPHLADPFVYVSALQAYELTDRSDPSTPPPSLMMLFEYCRSTLRLSPQNDALVRKIIQRTEALDVPAFSIKNLAKSLEALGNHVVVSEHELRRFLLEPHTAEDLEAMWVADGATWKPNPLSTFAKVAVLFETPDDLFLRPDRAPPVKIAPAAVETTVRPTLPPSDPYADAKAIFGDDFKPDELIKKALALVSSNKGQVRITADLQDALKHPSRYLRSDGLPSLPHMLLMRAHNGDAQSDMSIDAVSAALQTTFEPNGEAYKAPPRTGYRAFVWTLLSDAVAKGKSIASYADLLAAYDFKQANGGSINSDRIAADDMANGILGDVNNLFTRAAAGEALTDKRDTQLITKMVAVAGDIMHEGNPKDVVLGAFLGRVNRPARRAAANVRAAFLKLTADK